MESKKTIIGIGSPVVDAVAQVDESFLEQVDGEKGGMVLVDADTINGLIKLLPAEPEATPGGSAGNTLFALARMGASAAFLGKIGNCRQGEFYRNRFKELGGDASRFKVGEQPNARCLSLVTPDGERTMRTDLGAAVTLAPEEISEADFSGCDHAHIEGYLLFNEALMRRVLECAKAAGCTISLDLASFEVVQATNAILPDILKNYVDIVFANEEEASAFTGIKEDYAEMARRLGEYCDIAAVKIGPRGSYIAHNGKIEKAEAMHAAHVVDTTGAGDLWAAGFLYGWSQGRELTECARIGSILGAAVVQQRGSVLPEHVWADILDEVG
ncbi:MAG: adenosine kinase [Opitutales bacterium]